MPSVRVAPSHVNVQPQYSNVYITTQQKLSMAYYGLLLVNVSLERRFSKEVFSLARYLSLAFSLRKKRRWCNPCRLHARLQAGGLYSNMYNPNEGTILVQNDQRHLEEMEYVHRWRRATGDA